MMKMTCFIYMKSKNDILYILDCSSGLCTQGQNGQARTDQVIRCERQLETGC